jgi:formylglycine-generating enzyme required for sulfatase activity
MRVPRVALLCTLCLVGGLSAGHADALTAEQAKALQQEAAQHLGVPVERTVELGPGVSLQLVLVPAGEFLMGAPEGESMVDPDESPQEPVRIAAPFWLGKTEITNQQFRLFDPSHDSRFFDTNWKDRVGPGISANGDTQPVVRVTWHEAQDFCRWLGEKLNEPVRLPTEAEWEVACRAGTDTPWICSQVELYRYANFADASVASVKPWTLRDATQNDGERVSAAVGKYLPNAWGLQDMHGNVFEWCQSLYRPYPYSAQDGREDLRAAGPRVVRGGSWDDRPQRCRSAFRLSYPPDFAVYNVGFRVLVPAAATGKP